ncbi:hypothetical protein KAR91_12265 [Candidatus Pacearchaeota archaeon]|nr:hypothetical protein [Candidatus Pacearchaeota archaeon]
MYFRLPFHLILDKSIMETIEEIRKNTNPKLRDNSVINRCIKFTNYVVNHSVSYPAFKKELDKMLVTDDFRQFFFQGGIK